VERAKRSKRQTKIESNFRLRASAMSSLSSGRESFAPDWPMSMYSRMMVKPRAAQYARRSRNYLARYANSKYWVDFEDFCFYRMDVLDVYYVGGFGVMGWVSASEYDGSQPDPLADSMAEIIQHMNTDHKEALVLLAQKFARIESEEATMTAVDRLGFHVRMKTRDGIRGARIAFLREVSKPAETRKVLVEMVQQARSQAE
jgi:putative heme iron utilization protein